MKKAVKWMFGLYLATGSGLFVWFMFLIATEISHNAVLASSQSVVLSYTAYNYLYPFIIAAFVYIHTLIAVRKDLISYKDISSWNNVPRIIVYTSLAAVILLWVIMFFEYRYFEIMAKHDSQAHMWQDIKLLYFNTISVLSISVILNVLLEYIINSYRLKDYLSLIPPFFCFILFGVLSVRNNDMVELNIWNPVTVKYAVIGFFIWFVLSILAWIYRKSTDIIVRPFSVFLWVIAAFYAIMLCRSRHLLMEVLDLQTKPHLINYSIIFFGIISIILHYLVSVKDIKH